MYVVQSPSRYHGLMVVTSFLLVDELGSDYISCFVPFNLCLDIVQKELGAEAYLGLNCVGGSAATAVLKLLG